jgi:kynurenine formamidase
VLFHTGWLKLIGKDDKRHNAGEPGVRVDGARYLASLGVAMVGADTWAVEVLPGEKDTGAFPVHQIFLATNGTHILENMNTGEMVKDKAYEAFSPSAPPGSPARSRRSSIRSRSSNGRTGETTRRCTGPRVR